MRTIDFKQTTLKSDAQPTNMTERAEFRRCGSERRQASPINYLREMTKSTFRAELEECRRIMEGFASCFRSCDRIREGE